MLYANKHSNILKILQPKKENFQIKTFDIFLISSQNIDCEYSLKPPQRGGSNEYLQSMILSRNKKNNVYPCKPQFYYIKVGFNAVKIVQACFCDGISKCRVCFKNFKKKKCSRITFVAIYSRI